MRRGGASLSRLTGHNVLLEVPEVSVHPMERRHDSLHHLIEHGVASVHRIFSGPVAGDALLMLDPFAASGPLPHIIATDLGLPGEDGRAFLCELRELPREQGGELPAIAVTASAAPADRDRVLDAGFTLHLEKPVSPLAVASAIARVAAGSV